MQHDTTTMTTDAPFAADDPRAFFARAVATAGRVIERVRPDQLTASTPCDEFDVRALLGHLLGVLQRVAVVGVGGSATGVEDVIEGVADDGWADAWRSAAHGVQAAWTDDATLAQTIELPWAELSGAEALAMYTSEVTVHTWDLATATRQDPDWDDDVVGVAMDSIRRHLPAEDRLATFEAVRAQLPPDARNWGAPFHEVVPVAGDARPIDRLVAWNGRRPVPVA